MHQLSSKDWVLPFIPSLRPGSRVYTDYWRTEKRKCLEGYWSGGTWCPPQLYFYLNFWHIRVAVNVYSKAKKVLRPFFRVVEWDKAYCYTEAIGFSGFSEDEVYTCHREVRDYVEGAGPLPEPLRASCLRKDGTLKEYMPAREYLRLSRDQPLGKPVYLNRNQNFVDLESRGCFAPGTKARMFDGSLKCVEDIQKGDQLMGPDGTVRTVQWTHSGVEVMYKVKRKKGKDIIVNANHELEIWEKVYTNGKYVNGKRNNGTYKDIKHAVVTSDLYAKQHQTAFTNTHYIYQSEAVPYPQKKLRVDPYYLGLWLADGRSNCTCVVNTDEQIWDYLEEFAAAEGVRCDVKEKPRVVGQKLAKEHYIKDADFRGEFHSYDLIQNKHIPHDYLYSSIPQRLQLLAGLIDGDGWLDSNEVYRVAIGPSLEFAQQVQELAQSLGFYSKINYEDNSKLKSHYKDFYSVYISGETSQIPVIQDRKKITHNTHRVDVTRSSFQLECLGEGEFYGFHLDKDHLFLLDDYTVQHNTGKSYWASNCIAHNWLFDGYRDYDEYFRDQASGEVQASETLVGAIDTKYSKGLLDKVQEGLKYLPGTYTEQLGDKDRVHPSPFAKKYTGSFEPGESIKAQYKVKKSGLTIWKGSGSQILHRSFNDNHLAGNGTRPGVAFLEEVGFFGNLLASLGALKDCMSESGVPIGTIYMMGTGGDMVGGATEQVQAVFYDPEQYNCVIFQDTYENSPKPQGYFLPFYKADNEYLDRETGEIDQVKSLAKCLKERDRLKKGKDKTAYNSELENRPLVPSEVFLVTSSNNFPVAQLKEQLGMVQTCTDASLLGTLGYLTRDSSGSLEFKPDLENALRLPEYPIRRGDNDRQKGRDVETEGAICLYHFPKPGMAYGLYGSGLDPYAKEKAVTSVSVGSLYVIERGCLENGGYDRIAAEYTGRPDSGTTEFNENSMNLIEFYNNHECLLEMNVGNFKGYLQNKNKLYLLALTPGITQNKVKDTNSTYGVWLGNKRLKMDMLQYVDDWLRKQATPEGKLQLQFIYSVGLLQELIGYNDDGNFDRVSAFACAVTQTVQLETVELAPQVEQPKDPFWTRKLFQGGRNSTSSPSHPALRKSNNINTYGR